MVSLTLTLSYSDGQDRMKIDKDTHLNMLFSRPGGSGVSRDFRCMNVYLQSSKTGVIYPSTKY